MKNLSSYYKRALQIFLFIITCSIIGFSLGRIISLKLNKDSSMVEFMLKMIKELIFLILAFIIHVISHETGHMLAALIRKWEFISFMLFGWVLSRQNGHFKISRFKLRGALGQCIMSPPENGDTNAGIMFYNAGGLIVNFILSLFAAILLLTNFNNLSMEGTLFCFALLIIGLLLGLTNGIPLKSTEIPNDGMNMINLHKDPFSSYIFIQTLRIVGRLYQGVDLLDASDGYLCDKHKLNYSNPIHIMGLSFDLSLAMAKMDFQKADYLLKTILPYENQISAIYLKEFCFEKIYLKLIVSHEKWEIDRLLTKDMRQYIEMQSHFRPIAIRVQYALARLHEQNQEKAEQLFDKFNRFSKTYYIPGEIYAEKRLVNHVHQLDLESSVF